MLKRIVSCLLLAVFVSVIALATPGCGNNEEVKVERHEEVNVEETVSEKLLVE